MIWPIGKRFIISKLWEEYVWNRKRRKREKIKVIHFYHKGTKEKEIFGVFEEHKGDFSKDSGLS